jgi:alkaline phosphatase D
MEPTRRTLLKAGAAVGVASTLSCLQALPADARTGASRVRSDPFRLGVASGDPWPDGFVLWTRLAVEPLAEDGLGGMPRAAIAVLWEVAEDPRMRRVVRRGAVTARPQHAHSVHVTLRDLRPGREYWYRFSVGSWVSETARTRTAPAPWSMPESLAMSFASCSQYEHGFFTAYRRLAEDEPDLILHLGDYQYEYTAGVYVAPGGNPRDHAGPETTDLATYRQRHAQYKTDADLQAAHAVAPWLVIWDDHEVDNNWADEINEKPEDQAGFLARRAAAFQAYYENMPLRRSSAPAGIDLRLYRRAPWGRLVNFHMLDTRQYRDDQACGDGYDDCPEADDPNRTITGDAQERWLINGFRQSNARWDVIGSRCSSPSATPTPVIRRSCRWTPGTATPPRASGSPAAGWTPTCATRSCSPATCTRTGPATSSSTTTTTTHEPSAPSWSAPRSPPTATGRTPPRVPTRGSRTTRTCSSRTALRGYVRTTITREEMVADFRCLPYVSRPGAPAFTRASFTIHDREPGLDLTYDNPPASTAARLRSPEKVGGDSTIRQETQRP